ncbi:class I adenylate-forming enzyme family protein [Mycolicibacterium moriokaense]|uniref:Acyl-CoA synthetase (AMP-forming)/AMP-acid ligase II n=1 Tax=Mycolicibacterium moriokaense TaxID=39691 RepID=A0A318HD87_9MYCO|nr:class I adenylate-forming enzyme family protein [Mycolicibacterium moriokaense]PXX01651.1 acyl-CoA synthetase (AMP-forming)/AMP-acid ligase II [Mycolicibacterium moriokaense]
MNGDDLMGAQASHQLPARRPVVVGEQLPDPVTVPALVRRGVRLWGTQPVLIHNGAARTWIELDRDSAELAKGLLALGVTKGSRVGLLMPNSADWAIAFLAAARIGAAVSPISTFVQGPELDRALAHGDVQVLLCVDRFLAHDYLARLGQLTGMSDQDSSELYLPNHPFLRRIVVWGNDSRPWTIAGSGALQQLAHARPEIEERLLVTAEDSVEPADPLLTIWTSGTTSLPKGVVHSHGGVLRFIHALRQIGRGDVRCGERAYAAMPFFWLGGLNTVFFPALIGGGTIVTTDQVAPAAVLDTIVEQQVSRVGGWLGPVVELIKTAAARGIDVSRVRGLSSPTYTDGSPIPAELLGNALGMTETFGPHSAEPLDAELPADKAGSMGRAVPGHDRQVIDPLTGTPLPPGEVGELRVRGPGMMLSYYRREAGECFDADGYLRTGDRCAIDADGFLFFHGRQSELIKTSGANVAPREVETVLQTYPEVAEAIVFGIPDERRGEAVVAAVVAASGAQLDPDSIRSRLRAEISHYKMPTQVIEVAAETIPRTDSGKPRKAALRDLLFASPEH